MGLTILRPAFNSRFVADGGGSRLLLPDASSRALVLMHGAQENPEILLENSGLASYAQELSLAVLLPSLGNSFGLDWGAGQDVRSFLMEELLPWARAQCPAFSERDRCAIGGISMGGFAALSTALGYPSDFGAVFSISGALNPKRSAQFCRISGADVPAGVASLASRPEAQLLPLLENANPRPALYLAWGDGDWFAKDNAAFAEQASALGCNMRVELSPGFHDWSYWRVSLPPALRWAAQK